MCVYARESMYTCTCGCLVCVNELLRVLRIPIMNYFKIRTQRKDDFIISNFFIVISHYSLHLGGRGEGGKDRGG